MSSRSKRRVGLASNLASRHKAVVGGYIVEGHVPLAAVARLLALRPADIRGIAVPGMPAGSLGMETPDGYREPFEITAFHRNGRTSRFGWLGGAIVPFSPTVVSAHFARQVDLRAE